MDGQSNSTPEPTLSEAIARARSVWESTSGGDPVAAARAAARCFSLLDTAEAAFWRGNFLTQGYMTATRESALGTAEVNELRVDGVDALRQASRSETGSISAQARYLLGQVDQLDRFR